jgi:hypothetical protein
MSGSAARLQAIDAVRRYVGPTGLFPCDDLRPSQILRWAASQPSTTARRSRSSVHVRTRPDFALRISPLRSSIRMCFMNDGSEARAVRKRVSGSSDERTAPSDGQ